MLAWIAEEFVRRWGDHQDSGRMPAPGLVIFHGADTVSEAMVWALWQGGIVEPARPDYKERRGFPNPFRFLVGHEALREATRAGFGDEASFDATLEAFLLLVTDLHGYPEALAAFTATGEIVPILDALHNTGHVEKQDDLYAWTDAVAPAMKRHPAWTRDGRTLRR